MRTRCIAYITGDYPSLTETFIAHEIDGLRALGFDIRVIALNDLALPKRAAASFRSPGQVLRAGFEAFRATGPATRRLRRAGAVTRALAIEDLCRGVDQIHAAFLGLPALAAYLAAQRLKKPYSIAAHANDIFVADTPRHVVERARLRIACTQAGVIAMQERFPGNDVELVRHGVRPNLPQRQGNARLDEPRMLAVGRLVEKKGFVYFVRACAQLKANGLPFQGLIVGEGPERTSLQSEIDRLGLAHEIALAGAQSHTDTLAIMSKSDFLVAPSIVAGSGDRDGLPNVILEAMSIGVPVVATRVSAIPEAILHGRTGILCGPNNPSALAREIRSLAGSSILYHAIARNGRDFVRSEFDSARWLARLADLFGGI